MSARILLVTSFTWTRADRLLGGFAAAGARVDALFPQGHPMGPSRHLNRGFAWRSLAPLACLREAIAESAPDLVVPCDDRIARHLVTLHAEGGPEHALLARSMGAPDLYPQMTARRTFLDAVAQAGAVVGAMTAVPSQAALDEAIAEMGLPIVLKSDHSWGGGGVAIARTRETAHAAYAAMARPPQRWREMVRAVRRRDAAHLRAAMDPQKPVIGAQRFITGIPATTSMACWRGEVMVANHFHVLQTQQDNGPASVLERVSSPQMDATARIVARRFGLSGLHGLDYMRDAEGVTHLLEINPRATPTAHLAFGPDHDLCGALIAALDDIPDPRPAIAGQRVVLFPQELTRDPHSPWLADAFHDIPWDDPESALASLPAGPLPDWLERGLAHAARPARRAANAYQAINAARP